MLPRSFDRGIDSAEGKERKGDEVGQERPMRRRACRIPVSVGLAAPSTGAPANVAM